MVSEFCICFDLGGEGMSAWLNARFEALYQDLAPTRLAAWLASLPQQVQTSVYATPHGKREFWLQT